MSQRLLLSTIFWLSLVILAAVVAAYPNPLLCFQTMARFVRLPIDPRAVAEELVRFAQDTWQTFPGRGRAVLALLVPAGGVSTCFPVWHDHREALLRREPVREPGVRSTRTDTQTL